MNVYLPDGSIKEMPENSTVADVAASIGSGLAKAALGGKINGAFADLSAVVPDGAKKRPAAQKQHEVIFLTEALDIAHDVIFDRF